MWYVWWANATRLQDSWFSQPLRQPIQQNMAWIECQTSTSILHSTGNKENAWKRQLKCSWKIPFTWDATSANGGVPCHLGRYCGGTGVPEPNHILIGAKHLQKLLIWEWYTLHHVATFPLVNLCKAMLLSKCPSPQLPWCFANWELRFPSSSYSIPY